MQTPEYNQPLEQEGFNMRGQFSDTSRDPLYTMGSYHEHPYSEIPPPPPEAFTIPDLKALEYNHSKHSSGTSYNKGLVHTSSPNGSGAYIVDGRTTGAGIHNVPPRTADSLGLDYYSRIKSPVCYCTKQVTIHVILMALAGVGYLAVGGSVGFWLGKLCKSHYLIYCQIIQGIYSRK